MALLSNRVKPLPGSKMVGILGVRMRAVGMRVGGRIRVRVRG
jgi:hypothetical protein